MSQQFAGVTDLPARSRRDWICNEENTRRFEFPIDLHGIPPHKFYLFIKSVFNTSSEYVQRKRLTKQCRGMMWVKGW